MTLKIVLKKVFLEVANTYFPPWPGMLEHIFETISGESLSPVAMGAHQKILLIKHTCLMCFLWDMEGKENEHFLSHLTQKANAPFPPFRLQRSYFVTARGQQRTKNKSRRSASSCFD